jgi:uncharacterized protein YkwD
MYKNMLKLSLVSFAAFFIIFSCKKDEGFHQVSAIEKQIHEEINNYRQDSGLNALVFQPILFREARAHSLRMVNGAISPGYDGLDAVFNDLSSKLGSGDAGAIVELTDVSTAKAIVELFIENASKNDVLLGKFTQSGVGYATDDSNINYITVLFLDIP